MVYVSDFIEDELKSYEENKQDYLICVYENETEVAREWIEDFKEKLPQYLNRKIKKIEYFTEVAYVYV